MLRPVWSWYVTFLNGDDVCSSVSFTTALPVISRSRRTPVNLRPLRVLPRSILRDSLPSIWPQGVPVELEPFTPMLFAHTGPGPCRWRRRA